MALKVTKQEAIERGLKHYDDSSCRVCSTSKKYVCNNRCVKCTITDGRRIEENGRYRATNSSKRIRDRSIKWLRENFFSKGCFYCKQQKHWRTMQADHKIAFGQRYRVSKKGFRYAYDYVRGKLSGCSIKSIEKRIKEYNLVPSCADCNHVKAKTLDKGTPEGKSEWRKYLREARKNIHKIPKSTRRHIKETAKRKGSRV